MSQRLRLNIDYFLVTFDLFWEEQLFIDAAGIVVKILVNPKI